MSNHLMAPNIVLVGKTNSGKSSLINALVGQDVAIVSQVEGTTTDPVRKRAELIPFGPVNFIDTAGFFDKTELGEKRKEKTIKEFTNASIVIVVKDNDTTQDEIDFIKSKVIDLSKMIVISNKADIHHSNEYLNVSTITGEGIEDVKQVVIKLLEKTIEKPLIGDVIRSGQTILHVIPIDSAAPKGRLILPQVQLLRECLDYGINSIVCGLDQLSDNFEKYTPDLVVCDSQVFNEVSSTLPKSAHITSYSILFARQKGDLQLFVEGSKIIDQLKEDSKVLMMESCTHNVTHEDIGMVRIPNLLSKHLGFKPNIQHFMGSDFPQNINDYDLIIHCGSCMLSQDVMKNRISIAAKNGIPITNYGITIAKITGILEQAIEIFNI